MTRSHRGMAHHRLSGADRNLVGVLTDAALECCRLVPRDTSARSRTSKTIRAPRSLNANRYFLGAAGAHIASLEGSLARGAHGSCWLVAPAVPDHRHSPPAGLRRGGLAGLDVVQERPQTSGGDLLEAGVANHRR